MENEKIFSMSTAKIYSLLLAKVQRKGRTKEELDGVILWLTGYSREQLEQCIAGELPYGRFFSEAPQLNPNRSLITGSICGVKLDQIKDPLMKEIRLLDKLADELAKGRPMEKILRK